MKARTKKKPEFYLGPPVLKDIVFELREEVDNIEKCGTHIVERPQHVSENQLADWLGEIDGSLVNMRIIMELLQEQADVLWDTIPDEEDGEIEDEPKELFWSLAEAARDFGLSPSTLRNQAVKGRLGAVKIGRNWCTNREWMEEYLASRKKNGKALNIPSP